MMQSDYAVLCDIFWQLWNIGRWQCLPGRVEEAAMLTQTYANCLQTYESKLVSVTSFLQLQSPGSVFRRDSRTDDLFQGGMALVTWCLGGQKGLRRMRIAEICKKRARKAHWTSLGDDYQDLTREWGLFFFVINSCLISLRKYNLGLCCVAWFNHTSTLSVSTRCGRDGDKAQRRSKNGLAWRWMFCSVLYTVFVEGGCQQ